MEQNDSRVVRITCGNCGKILKCSADLIGRKVQCPKCKMLFRIMAESAKEPFASEVTRTTASQTDQVFPALATREVKRTGKRTLIKRLIAVSLLSVSALIVAALLGWIHIDELVGFTDLDVVGRPIVLTRILGVSEGYASYPEFQIKNNFSKPISSISGRIFNTFEGRSVEQFGQDFEYEIPGGIEPNETRLMEPSVVFEYYGFHKRDKNNWQIQLKSVKLKTNASETTKSSNLAFRLQEGKPINPVENSVLGAMMRLGKEEREKGRQGNEGSEGATAD